MLLREALQSAIARLSHEHVPSPRLNAETLLIFTLNCDRAHLFAHPERELTAEEQSRYDEALTQRAKESRRNTSPATRNSGGST